MVNIKLKTVHYQCISVYHWRCWEVCQELYLSFNVISLWNLFKQRNKSYLSVQKNEIGDVACRMHNWHLTSHLHVGVPNQPSTNKRFRNHPFQVKIHLEDCTRPGIQICRWHPKQACESCMNRWLSWSPSPLLHQSVPLIGSGLWYVPLWLKNLPPFAIFSCLSGAFSLRVDFWFSSNYIFLCFSHPCRIISWLL